MGNRLRCPSQAMPTSHLTSRGSAVKHGDSTSRIFPRRPEHSRSALIENGYMLMVGLCSDEPRWTIDRHGRVGELVQAVREHIARKPPGARSRSRVASS